MMKTKMQTLILGLSAVLMLSSGLALAHPGQQWQGTEARKMRMMPLQQLDLSAEQRQQVAALMQQYRATQQAQRQQPALQALLDAPQFDELAAKQLLAERRAQREQHQLARLALQHEIHQVLTPEQRQQLIELRAQPKRRAMSEQARPQRQYKSERQ